ncbi:MAG: hypothetical protein KJO50_06930 [Bacteroidia bacterium]|nr:hypothetical protein [Bacteroidia bacterium]
MNSCRTVYTPNMHNVPLFKEKDEFRGTFGFNDFQLAYSPISHLGLMMNAQYHNGGSYSEPFEDGSARKYLIEGGIGYYRNFERSGVFELYGGGGYGGVSFDHSSDSEFSAYNSKLSRFFIQPSIGFTSEFFDLSFSMRFIRLNYFDHDISEYEPGSAFDEDYDLRELNDHIYTFLEPGITLRVGWNQVKFHMQFIRTLQLNDLSLNHRRGIVNIGVHVNFASRYSIGNQEDKLEK